MQVRDYYLNSDAYSVTREFNQWLHRNRIRKADFRQLDQLETARAHYPQLHSKQREMWDAFLPTHNSLTAYTDSAVPPEVRRYLKRAEKIGCFDWIGVQSSVGNSVTGETSGSEGTEAMLVGGIRRRQSMGVDIFQIVRWGEPLTDEAQIEQYYSRTSRWRRLLDGIIPLTLIIGTALIGLIITLIGGSTWPYNLGLCVLGMVIALPGSFGVAMLWCALRSNYRLMSMIDRRLHRPKT